MSKRYVKELPNGGLEVTMFVGQPPSDHSLMEVEHTELEGKNLDKCRIQNGSIVEDSSIKTQDDIKKELRDAVILKLKAIGLTDKEIEVIVR